MAVEYIGRIFKFRKSFIHEICIREIKIARFVNNFCIFLLNASNKYLFSILANLADFTQRFQVMRVDRPLNGLPTAQTCFFQLRLPPYSSKVIIVFWTNYFLRILFVIIFENRLGYHERTVEICNQ